MARSDVFCEGDEYYCCRLSAATPDDERDIMAFRPVDPRGAGLTAYLQRLAFPEELAGVMRTYLVRDRDNDELAGYFSLKAGLVTQDEVQLGGGRAELDTVPGVELANFAVNGAYREAHPQSAGCGQTIYHELVMEVARRAAGVVGIALVYLFALPDERVIGAYRRYGFSRLSPEREERVHARIKPRYDAQCVFMYAPI